MSHLAKQVLQAKHAYVAALLAGVTALAAAQASAPSAAASAPQGQQQHEMDHHGAMRGHFFEKMQARLKEKLKITPEQEPAWAAFTASMKPPEMGMHEAPDFAALEKMTTPERMEKMRALHEQRHTEHMALEAKHEEAVKTFYAALNPDQKKTFDEATLRMMRARHWQHEHHGHDGDWHGHD